MSSKSTESAWKWRKSEKIAWVSVEHSRTVVRSRSELAGAMLWLAFLHSKVVLSEGSIYFSTWFFQILRSDIQQLCLESLEKYQTKRGNSSVPLSCVYLEGSDSRAAVVDSRGQQALPALRVIFVGQLASTQFYIQHTISGQDGPEGNVKRHCLLNHLTKPITNQIKTFLLDRTNI